jgi:GMP synthase (glutamine-hydrolysing)
MSGTVILVDHPVGRRDDRASQYLAARGYRIEWRSPGKGEALPEVGPEHVGAVVYGGAESANDDGPKPYLRTELDWIERWLETGKPFLGLCLGGQMLARVLGARVDPHPEAFYEIGYVPIEPTPAADSFLDGVSHVYHWHHEGFTVPEGTELLATGPVFPNQAFRYGPNVYGLQFHPEVTVPVMTRWMDEAGHMLAQPNAHPRERQLADAERFDPPPAARLQRFLEGWLGKGE